MHPLTLFTTTVYGFTNIVSSVWEKIALMTNMDWRTQTYGLMDTDIWFDGHRHMDWRTQTYGLTDTDRVIPLYTVCKGYNYHWKSSHNPCLPFIIIDCLCLYVTSQISLLLKPQPFTPIMMILENLIHVPVCK